MKKVNTTLIYVLSSIGLLCCCLGGLGILLALPAFIIANKKMKEVAVNPTEYDLEDIKALENAKTFAMISLIINGLNFVYSLYNLATTDWDVFMQKYNDLIEKYRQ